jgi:hypothetical protein
MGKITTEDFTDILGKMDITMKMFSDLLREELAVQEFQKMYAISLQGMPPAQRWDYYCRTHRQATIECIPVSVKELAVAVPAPSDDELKAFFEKYKDDLPQPDSADPGFRIPQKIEIEYLKAEVDKFATPENVTDEEIQTYYAKDPKTYDSMNLKSLMNELEKSGAKKETPEEKPAGDKPAEEKPAEDKPAEEKPVEDKPAEDAKPADGTAQPAAPEGEKKEGEKKEGEQPAPASPEKPADNTEGKSSSVEHSPYRLTSLQADENTEKPNPPKTEAPPAADAKAPEAPAADAKPAETNPADAKPADTTPTTDQNPPPADAAAKAPGESSDIQAPAPRRELTEEVKQAIRQRVAEDKILANFAKITPSLNENAKAWKRYNSAITRKEKDLAKPPKFDFAGEAAKYGFSVGATGEVNKWEAAEKDIGTSQLLQSKQPFSLAAFELAKFTPVTARDLKGDLYLFWKIKDGKEAAPKWDDPAVQKQVLEAWQRVKARDAALKKADQLAEKARVTKATLKETFAGVANVEVLSPPAFTWMTSGNMPLGSAQLRYSNIEGVDMAGDDFMKTVFTLDPMGVGTAMNHPKTIAYVIQTQKFDPTDKVLWDLFLRDDINKYADAGRSDMFAAHKAMREQLQKDAGLKWERKADHFEKEEAAND